MRRVATMISRVCRSACMNSAALCLTWGNIGPNHRAPRLIRNAKNFVIVLALKEIYNLRGESAGRLTLHLRRVNVT